MKIKTVLFFIVLAVFGISGYAKNTTPKQEENKSSKLKYDFTIFKLFAFDNQQSKVDSTKVIFTKTPLKKED